MSKRKTTETEPKVSEKKPKLEEKVKEKKERKKSESKSNSNESHNDSHTTISPNTPPGDPPEPEELIKVYYNKKMHLIMMSTFSTYMYTYLLLHCLLFLGILK